MSSCFKNHAVHFEIKRLKHRNHNMQMSKQEMKTSILIWKAECEIQGNRELIPLLPKSLTRMECSKVYLKIENHRNLYKNRKPENLKVNWPEWCTYFFHVFMKNLTKNRWNILLNALQRFLLQVTRDFCIRYLEMCTVIKLFLTVYKQIRCCFRNQFHFNSVYFKRKDPNCRIYKYI